MPNVVVPPYSKNWVPNLQSLTPEPSAYVHGCRTSNSKRTTKSVIRGDLNDSLVKPAIKIQPLSRRDYELNDDDRSEDDANSANDKMHSELKTR